MPTHRAPPEADGPNEPPGRRPVGEDAHHVCAAPDLLVQPLPAWNLLVIEGLGMRRLPSTAVEDLLEVFTRRYEQGAIILTANRPLED